MTITTSAASSTTSNSAATTAAGTSSVASQQLAGNFDTFLQLLTTQLQNQNPLDPLDTNQFTQQLVEFASVEQQVDMNSNLQTMISLQQSNEATSAMQFLGSTVTINSSAAALSNANGAPASWSFTSPSPATGTFSITNSSGEVVDSGTLSLTGGSQTFTWNGQGNNGVTWPDGNYTLAVNATAANGQPVTVSTQVQGVVSAVDLSQNPPQLIVGGQDYPISAVQSIGGGGTAGGLSSLNSTISNLSSAIGTLTQLL